jgi:hypothetical protein
MIASLDVVGLAASSHPTDPVNLGWNFVAGRV